MKVLMVASFDANGRYKGGVEYVANGIFEKQEYFNDRGIELFKLNTCLVKRKQKTSGKFSFINIKNYFLVKQNLKKEIKEIQPDEVYVHSSVGLALIKDLLLLKTAKKKNKNIKTFIHIHHAEINNIIPQKKLLRKYFFHLITKYVDRIILLSEKTKNQFINIGFNNVSLLYNFHKMDYFIDKSEKMLLTEHQNLDILFMGTINKNKAIILLLKALQSINDNVILHVCGGEPTPDIKEEYNSLVEELGEKVILHGYVSGDEKNDIFYKCPIFILPSYSEGLPISILEAFASGCAVIATDVGANSEIIGKENGILIHSGSIEEIANAIEKYYDDRELLKNTMKNNIEYSKRFSLDAFAESFANILLD